jgi:hypothetical protein
MLSSLAVSAMTPIMLLTGRFERLPVAGDQRHVHALQGQLAGDGLADATAAAGDDGNLAGQLEIHQRPPTSSYQRR